MSMTPEQIRGKFWALREKYLKTAGETIERQQFLFIAEMLSELTAQQAEQSAFLRQKLGPMNTERLALLLEDFFNEKKSRLQKKA
jgi:hypothetical protein